jgi:hypothetical protein
MRGSDFRFSPDSDQIAALRQSRFRPMILRAAKELAASASDIRREPSFRRNSNCMNN